MLAATFILCTTLLTGVRSNRELFSSYGVSYRQPVVSSADFMSPASIYPPHPCAREDRDRAQIVPEIDDVGSVTCCCCCSLSAYYSYRDLSPISHLAPQGLLQRESERGLGTRWPLVPS